MAFGDWPVAKLLEVASDDRLALCQGPGAPAGSRPNPPEAWVTEWFPELRIIGEALWERVKLPQSEIDAEPEGAGDEGQPLLGASSADAPADPPRSLRPLRR